MYVCISSYTSINHDHYFHIRIPIHICTYLHIPKYTQYNNHIYEHIIRIHIPVYIYIYTLYSCNPWFSTIYSNKHKIHQRFLLGEIRFGLMRVLSDSWNQWDQKKASLVRSIFTIWLIHMYIYIYIH